MIQKLREEFDKNFTVDDVKKSVSLLIRYRRERQAEKVSRSSWPGIDDVFNSDWGHFQQMVFLESTPETDLSMSTPYWIKKT